MTFETFLPLILVIFLVGMLCGFVLAVITGEAGARAGRREYLKRHAGRLP